MNKKNRKESRKNKSKEELLDDLRQIELEKMKILITCTGVKAGEASSQCTNTIQATVGVFKSVENFRVAISSVNWALVIGNQDDNLKVVMPTCPKCLVKLREYIESLQNKPNAVESVESVEDYSESACVKESNSDGTVDLQLEK